MFTFAQNRIGMEKDTLKTENEKRAAKEELLRRLEVNRRRKREFVEKAKEVISEEYKKLMGREPDGFEVW